MTKQQLELIKKIENYLKNDYQGYISPRNSHRLKKITIKNTKEKGQIPFVFESNIIEFILKVREIYIKKLGFDITENNHFQTTPLSFAFGQKENVVNEIFWLPPRGGCGAMAVIEKEDYHLALMELGKKDCILVGIGRIGAFSDNDGNVGTVKDTLLEETESYNKLFFLSLARDGFSFEFPQESSWDHRYRYYDYSFTIKKKGGKNHGRKKNHSNTGEIRFSTI